MYTHKDWDHLTSILVCYQIVHYFLKLKGAHGSRLGHLMSLIIRPAIPFRSISLEHNGGEG